MQPQLGLHYKSYAEGMGRAASANRRLHISVPLISLLPLVESLPCRVVYVMGRTVHKHTPWLASATARSSFPKYVYTGLYVHAY